MGYLVARPYQLKLKGDIYSAWGALAARNVLAVLPTGAGKTFTFTEVIKEHRGSSCAIAHRQELVSQISLAFARAGIRHKIIGPKKVVKLCVNIHMQELGKAYYDPSAPCAVAGVDTLIRREKQLSHWLNSVTLWVLDESHHLIQDNKWGIAVKMFPNARGLGVTATPLRADGKGLGRHADGVFDYMAVGPSMRELINMGYLTDYRIFAPASDIDLSNVPIGESGDYSRTPLVLATRKSHIVGDVVKEYLKHAKGKLGVTFATDVLTAKEIAEQFNAAGVPAAVVSAETPDDERVAVLRKFKNRELLQLVNVDLFGEGFDLPAIEVVSMARPTKSFGLFVQQFGRGLRIMIDDKLYPLWDSFTDEQRRYQISISKKPVAILIDHVNNIDPAKGGHGLPDAPRKWTLNRREKRAQTTPDDVMQIKLCVHCTRPYDRFLSVCPWCGTKPIPVSRSGPEFVDGDLTELDPAKLAEMRGEVAKLDMDKEKYRLELFMKGVPKIGQLALVKKHVEKQESQRVLREAIAWWAGYQRAAGRLDSESYRRFYFKFNIDVLSAQTLNSPEALELAGRINKELTAV